MDNPTEILKSSLKLLINQPKLFAPKLFSTILASGIIIYFVSSPKFIQSINLLYTTSLMFGVLIFVSILGIFSSMMLASMVKTQENSLKKSFIEVMNNKKIILTTTVIFLFISLFTGILFSISYSLYLVTGKLLYSIITVILSLILLYSFSYSGYFLPITLLLEKNTLEAFKKSFASSNDNKLTVNFLLILSLMLIGLAIFSTGYLEKIGYAGFLIGRILSSVINTYVFTISPNFYLVSSSQSLK